MEVKLLRNIYVYAQIETLVHTNLSYCLNSIPAMLADSIVGKQPN